MAAQLVQQGLHLVGQLGYIAETKRRGPALHRVCATENTVQILIISGDQIHIEQHLLHEIQVFTGFFKKDLIELAQVKIVTATFLMHIRHS